MLRAVLAAVARRPSTWHAVSLCLLQYRQARYMYAQGSFWEPALLASPTFEGSIQQPRSAGVPLELAAGGPGQTAGT